MRHGLQLGWVSLPAWNLGLFRLGLIHIVCALAFARWHGASKTQTWRSENRLPLSLWASEKRCCSIQDQQGNVMKGHYPCRLWYHCQLSHKHHRPCCVFSSNKSCHCFVWRWSCTSSHRHMISPWEKHANTVGVLHVLFKKRQLSKLVHLTIDTMCLPNDRKDEFYHVLKCSISVYRSKKNIQPGDLTDHRTDHLRNYFHFVSKIEKPQCWYKENPKIGFFKCFFSKESRKFTNRSFFQDV